MGRSELPPRSPAPLVAPAFAPAEGAGSNSISLAVIDRQRTTAGVGALAHAAFLAADTPGRRLGPLVVDRPGRPGVLRVAAGSAALGVVLFAFGPGLRTGFAGALPWGAGAALGLPVGSSAGSDDPARAAARVGVITSTGYCGFVCGPPLIGFLADQAALAPALLVVAALTAVSSASAGATRAAPPPADEEAADAALATPAHSAHQGASIPQTTSPTLPYSSDPVAVPNWRSSRRGALGGQAP